MVNLTQSSANSIPGFLCHNRFRNIIFLEGIVSLFHQFRIIIEIPCILSTPNVSLNSNLGTSPSFALCQHLLSPSRDLTLQMRLDLEAAK